MLFLCNFLQFSIISSNLRSNIFFSNTNVCDTLTVKDVASHKCASNVILVKWHTHTCMQGDSGILDIAVGYGPYSQLLGFPNIFIIVDTFL
jgi:hypothetical protein